MVKAKQYEDVAFPGMEDLPTVPTVERQAPPKSIGTAPCRSCCQYSNKRGSVGVVKQNGHLVWRDHTKTTYSGAVIPCPTSGVRLCVSTPLPNSLVTSKIQSCCCTSD